MNEFKDNLEFRGEVERLVGLLNRGEFKRDKRAISDLTSIFGEWILTALEYDVIEGGRSSVLTPKLKKLKGLKGVNTFFLPRKFNLRAVDAALSRF